MVRGAPVSLLIESGRCGVSATSTTAAQYSTAQTVRTSPEARNFCLRNFPTGSGVRRRARRNDKGDNERWASTTTTTKTRSCDPTSPFSGRSCCASPSSTRLRADATPTETSVVDRLDDRVEETPYGNVVVRADSQTNLDDQEVRRRLFGVPTLRVCGEASSVKDKVGRYFWREVLLQSYYF